MARRTALSTTYRNTDSSGQGFKLRMWRSSPGKGVKGLRESEGKFHTHIPIPTLAVEDLARVLATEGNDFGDGPEQLDDKSRVVWEWGGWN